MVVEVAGGKKQDGGKDLPGYTEIALSPSEVAAVPVVRGKKRKYSCCILYLLLICALVGTSIYFGVMSQKYKKDLHHMKKQCQANDGFPMPNRDDEPDKGHQSTQKPNGDNRPGGWPYGRPNKPHGGHGNHDNDDKDDDVFDTIAEILEDCVDIENLKEVLAGGGEFDFDLIQVDKGCVEDKWQEIKGPRKDS